MIKKKVKRKKNEKILELAYINNTDSKKTNESKQNVLDKTDKEIQDVTFGFCSKEIDIPFYKYLKKTLGNEVQIINKVNVGVTKTLTQGLNEIIDESVNDIIILCHNDIEFQSTEKYKDSVKNIFIRLFTENKDYAIIGLIGGSSINVAQPNWANIPVCGHIIQGHKNTDKKDEYLNFGDLEPFSVSVDEKLILDGMFIAIHKNRIKARFDETNKLFHYYDSEFCLQNSILGAKIGVTKAILIKHFSEGNTKEFNKLSQYFTKKYESVLPYRLKP